MTATSPSVSPATGAPNQPSALGRPGASTAAGASHRAGVAAPRRFTRVATPLGEMILVSDGVAGDQALCGVYFTGQRHQPSSDQLGAECDAGTDPFLQAAADQLGEYFAGTRREFDLPVAARGTDFEQRVWALLRRVGFGTTTSYGQLAEQLGNRHLAQGVGQAVGHNPVSIVVPCHRVVGADGRLTGYAGGVERKQALLSLEQSVLETRLF
ncbi:methylated-DNA--[protein]-cysteine S-methyltransferase [Propionibacterium freudenreichii]|uniref:methylated-DNA--[protein]-cysteine S-methyltransferase n=1 Tax=Propionibacterium freudenreichii TaxID=1744 RepID=UPI000BC354ED|nr:methylated-DNA--[protein]-cysteine S-methyltransferase [Propionibacterium freudenreichii]WGU90671.1 methylated-DNA--[protein]-cysteine S-methyltransferase [Propionibacterium freudenreichii]SCQ60059.1 O-6-methylguanine DNA methyltransferase [Propionibacterium freudenreichii]SCQ66906.1 O-6-methylguanine DNA methyltransferase [Propionibacterium freudenreichii]SCQ70486.1 O-6-methylguanine DNA methyltransferase [Propionibacterium freudenreichii]SCQ79369.1 O-6-methylguanine DNA methyltransferase 